MDRRHFTMAMGFALLAGAGLSAGDPTPLAGPNLIDNGGFENAVTVEVTTNHPTFRALLDRGVALSIGAKVPMPAMVSPNPADGWVGPGNRFALVAGQAGAEVFAGGYALRIESPQVSSAFTLGKAIPVAEGLSLDDRVIQVGVPYPFSFWARGTGTVRATCYLYNSRGENLYDYAARRKVTPERFPLTDDGRWHRYEGTLTVISPDVDRLVFVMGVQGALTLDEVVLPRR